VNANAASHIELIKKQHAAGDLCGVYTNFQNYAKSYRGIPAYDELLTEYGTLFKQPENAEKLKFGREFYNIMAIINKAGTANAAALDALKKFSETHAGTAHGKAAKTAHEKLSANPSAKLTPESCFGR
jgi:hypothetical protein